MSCSSRVELVVLLLLAVLAVPALCALPSESSYCGRDGTVRTVTTPIVGNIQPGNEHSLFFVGSNRAHVFALSTEAVLYHSQDEGHTWENEMDELQNSDVPAGRQGGIGVRQIVTTAAPNQIWFLGHGGNIWVTSDTGNSYQLRTIPYRDFIPETFSAHPYFADWALVLGYAPGCFDLSSPCRPDVYVTRDFGASWATLTTYVVRAQWGVDGMVNGPMLTNATVVSIAWPDKTGDYRFKSIYSLQIQATTDWGLTSRTLLDHAAGLLLHRGVFFAAVLPSAYTNTIQLHVSLDGGLTFDRTVFPHDSSLTENGYTILDVDEGVAFVSVDHSDNANNMWGNLYVSDGFDEDFALSLERVRYGVQANARMVDFSTVQVNGVYIANYIPSADSLRPGQPRNPRSVITFNKGGDWRHIPAPTGSTCATRTCILNLNGPAESLYGRVYSDEDAVGLLMATGNIGEDLSPPFSTFFSRDAGLTWFPIAAGSNTYEFADYGGLTLIAPLAPQPSQSVSFTWNEGRQLELCNFSSTPVYFDDIIVDRDIQKRSFIAVGKRRTPGGADAGVLVHFDFSHLHTRDCIGLSQPGTVNSDYENWSPTDGMSNCILGQTSVYVRRLRDAACFNAEEKPSEPVASGVRCPCQRFDYECAPCYVENRTATNRTCVFDARECPNTDVDMGDPTLPCRNPTVQYYYENTAYRLVAGDICDPSTGLNLLGGRRLCPPRGGSSFPIWGGMLVFLLVVGAIVGGFVFLLHTNEGFHDFWARTVPAVVGPTFGRATRYSSLQAPDSMDDEAGAEAKELEDEDLPSAAAKASTKDSAAADAAL